MSVEASERLLSLEEFEKLPDDGYRLELVRGRLVREPPAGDEHGWLTGELVGRLYAYARERRLGMVVNETGFLLSDDPPTVREPDAAVVATGNLPREGLLGGFWRQAPDLAVEVVSPSNTAVEIQEKVLEYLDAGSRIVWVVDPRSRSVTVYRSREDIRLLTEGDTLEGGDVLPGFRLPIAELFEPFWRGASAEETGRPT